MFQYPRPLLTDKVTPTLIFWAFALLHILLWTLAPVLFCSNPHLDIIEGYIWGREWVMGTSKHPPLQAWVLEIMAIFTNRASWAPFLSSQIAVITSFWAVWKLGCRLTNEKAALIGVLLLEGVIYFNLTSPEFNPNVLQLPFTALTALFFHRSLKENKLTDWALLGLWIAAGLYSKYSFGLLPGLLTLFLFVHPEARSRLKSAGPYLTLFVVLALFLPHILWLISDHFQAFAYVGSRTASEELFFKNIQNTGRFIGSQLAALAFLIILFLFLCQGEIKKKTFSKTSTLDQSFLHLIALGPFFTIISIALLLQIKLHDMWGTSLWCFAGLWAVVFLDYDSSEKSLKLFSKLFAFVFALGLIIFGSMDYFGPAVMHYGKRVHFPGQALAVQMEQFWQKQFNEPLSYTMGNMWLAGNVAFFNSGAHHERPHVFIELSKEASPWIDEADLKTKGGLIFWCGRICGDEFYAKTIPPYYSERFPQALVQEPLTLEWQTGFQASPIVIGWAVVPPAP